MKRIIKCVNPNYSRNKYNELALKGHSFERTLFLENLVYEIFSTQILSSIRNDALVKEKSKAKLLKQDTHIANNPSDEANANLAEERV